MINIDVKKFIKLIIPSFLIKNINKLFKREIKFEGSYKNWRAADNKSLGYDSSIIFNKAKKSFLKVINKEAKYERDSVLFYSEEINSPLIKILKKKQDKKKICLKVLDFGGSFGSTYFQNYSILSDKNKFHWSIIEQKKIVNFAKRFKLPCNLFFFSSIKSYIKKNNPDIVLFSSVVQYLEFPYKIINYFIKKKIKNIIFLKTPFSKTKELIKIQIVPKNIYDASYPIRIFNEKFFLKLFKDNNYKIIPSPFINEQIDNIFFKNFIFKLNNYDN
jgi:putative methyltransferase (TIGR04325 family)